MIQLQNNKILLHIICKKYEESLFPLNQGNFPKTLLSQTMKNCFILKNIFSKNTFYTNIRKNILSENAFFQKSKNTFQISLSHKNSMWKSFILKRLRQIHFSKSITKTKKKSMKKSFVLKK